MNGWLINNVKIRVTVTVTLFHHINRLLTVTVLKNILQVQTYRHRVVKFNVCLIFGWSSYHAASLIERLVGPFWQAQRLWLIQLMLRRATLSLLINVMINWRCLQRQTLQPLLLLTLLRIASWIDCFSLNNDIVWMLRDRSIYYYHETKTI